MEGTESTNYATTNQTASDDNGAVSGPRQLVSLDDLNAVIQNLLGHYISW